MLFIPVYLIFIPVFTALIIYVFKSKYVNYLALVAQFAMTVLLIMYYNAYGDQPDATLFVFGDWDARVGISLYNDRLSLSFMFLTIFTWWMVLIYTFNFRETNEKNDNFLFFLMFLQGVFLGFLQSNDLFNLFVFLELTTILVTILIAFKKTGDAYRAGIYYELINVSGVLFFLIGIIILYNSFGTINVLAIQQLLEGLPDYVALRMAYIFLMIGASVKAALFPLYTWLPKAHGVAQSGISALLSGLVVKGGLYLFIRINDMFSPANYSYSDFFFVVGGITAGVGVMFALSQKDMKQILAYHTVSQVGIMMMGLSSLPTNDLFYGGLYHVFNHALFKSLLFLGAGVIIQAYRTKKVSDIRGVMKTMPVVSVLMIVGMLSITGAPLFNGFISKTIIKYGIYDQEWKYWILFFVNIGTATSFIKMSQIFFGPKPMTILLSETPQRVSMIIIAFSCVILGTFYIPISTGFFGVDLSYVSPFGLLPLYDYIATLTIGFAFYKLVIEKDVKPVRMIREFKVSFETANYLMVIYVVALVTYFIIL